MKFPCRKSKIIGWAGLSCGGGSDHEDAVTNVLVADLYARASFTEDSYDEEMRQNVAAYQAFAGAYDGGDFLTYLKNTPDESFFAR